MRTDARPAPAGPPRLPALLPADLDAAQRQLWDALAAGGRGAGAVRAEGFLTGPFDVLLRSPAVGQAVADLGALLRFESDLAPRHRELAICVVAGRWQARYAWFRHEQYARDAGIPADALAAITAGEVPTFDTEPDQTVWRYVDSLVRTGAVTDDEYAAAVLVLGERPLVELTSLAGYYCLCSFVLNAFRVPLPDGVSSPWDEAAR